MLRYRKIHPTQVILLYFQFIVPIRSAIHLRLLSYHQLLLPKLHQQSHPSPRLRNFSISPSQALQPFWPLHLLTIKPESDESLHRVMQALQAPDKLHLYLPQMQLELLPKMPQPNVQTQHLSTPRRHYLHQLHKRSSQVSPQWQNILRRLHIWKLSRGKLYGSHLTGWINEVLEVYSKSWQGRNAA